MKIRITYCIMWNYKPKAQVVAVELRNSFDGIDIDLQEGSSGVFDVMLLGDSYNTADRIVFSKHIKGRFPDEGEITKLLK